MSAPGLGVTDASLAYPAAQLTPYHRNPRRGNVTAIAESLTRSGQYRAVVANRGTHTGRPGEVLAGNHTLAAALSLGWESLAVTWVDVDDTAAARIVLADNRTADLATYDEPELSGLIADLGTDLSGTGYDEGDLDALLAALQPPAPPAPARPSLADRFVIPPMSVLDARTGAWAERKRQWLGLGIVSELGRQNDLLGGTAPVGEGGRSEKLAPRSTQGAQRGRPAHGPHVSRDPATGKLSYAPPPSVRKHDGVIGVGLPTPATGGLQSAERAAAQRTNDGAYGAPSPTTDPQTGELIYTATTGATSIFDPVLAELAVRWFSPPTGHVLDPFAGGSVRGLVTTILGRSYEGIDLRAEQIDANREQAHLAGPDADLVWHQGDSNAVLPTLPRPADMLLSCPPYADLEVYSEDPADLSTMSISEFRRLHASIIGKAVERLAQDRYAVWVIGDVRQRRGDGRYHGLIRDTIDAFEAAGCGLYNELILVTPLGSLPVRVGRAFTASRKTGRTHQHVLVFAKGDGRAAARACGDIDVTMPEPAEGERGEGQ